MVCVENMSAKANSDVEEGEIVDDVEDVFSDISSGEEFLLRQRLEVLENYNNVLERKKAKRSSIASGTKQRERKKLRDLSDISASELEDVLAQPYKNIKEQRYKTNYKQKRRNGIENNDASRAKERDYKKKNHRPKKKVAVKIMCESSEESEDEYRNKRRKLENAVSLNKLSNSCNDKSTLTARLQKMLSSSSTIETSNTLHNENKLVEAAVKTDINLQNFSLISENEAESKLEGGIQNKILSEKHFEVTETNCELIDLCTDDDKTVQNGNTSHCTVDTTNKYTVVEEDKKITIGDSDEDLELLRQHALNTKVTKIKVPDTDIQSKNDEKHLSEDEDSDTAELRLICLKSTLLKKAIEMKRKQKLKKRLSQSSSVQDDVLIDQEILSNSIDCGNNTDIESVDMDIGSDADEKTKDCSNDCEKILDDGDLNTNLNHSADVHCNKNKEDEYEEDEDLLRAKLLTSLSKNLPNLVDSNMEKPLEESENITSSHNKVQAVVPEEKRFVINLGESDSEGEHEATKNLTKMHMKLSEQMDFQQKLDLLLKSTRLEVEKTTLPDVVLQQPIQKTNEKFVPKAVNHLPKSEQMEYKNLVKRMAELEKIKQSRQMSINLQNKLPVHPIKDTLKPRNITIESNLTKIKNLEEQIALSRKNIAEESAKMLKLKEESTKLSQKYKIVETELCNIATAITLNKKQQRSVQNSLLKIRLHHQMLLKSSTMLKHSKNSGRMMNGNRSNSKLISTSRLQKENNPTKDEYKNNSILKSVKVSVVNDLQDQNIASNPRLSVQIDVISNKKIIKVPKSPVKVRVVDIINNDNGNKVDDNENKCDDIINSSKEYKVDAGHPVVEKGGGNNCLCMEVKPINDKDPERRCSDDDYKSPLEAFGFTSWQGDPNAILCPFEVDGDCKDNDCKFLHHMTPAQQ